MAIFETHVLRVRQAAVVFYCLRVYVAGAFLAKKYIFECEYDRRRLCSVKHFCFYTQHGRRRFFIKDARVACKTSRMCLFGFVIVTTAILLKLP